MPKSKKRSPSPESFSDDSEGWANELTMREIAQVMASHQSWETLLFDDRLFDNGIYECFDWLKAAWSIIESRRKTTTKLPEIKEKN